MKNNQIPSNWKKIKISKAFEFIPTTSHSKAELTYEQNDNSPIYNIHYGDIHAKYKIYVNFEKDKVPQLIKKENGFTKNLLNSGDLVMVDASEDLAGIGTCIEIKNLNNKKCVAGLHTFALRDLIKCTTPGYRGLMLKHKAIKHRMQQISTYSKVFGLSKKSFSKIELILPPLPEQEKIVEVLETWDEYLEKLSKIIKSKRKIKKYLSNRLVIGQIRLKGFNKKWSESTLEDYVEVNGGYGFPIHSQGKSNEKFPFLKVSDMNLHGNEFKITVWNNSVSIQDLIHLKAKPFDAESIIFPKIGAAINTNKKRMITIPSIVDNNVMVATSKNNCNPYFLYQWFLLINISNWANAGGVPSIRKSSILEHPVVFPFYEEQTAIAEILTTADQEIENLEKKRQLIEAQKKFLLNNLITGKIRLPEFNK